MDYPRDEIRRRAEEAMALIPNSRVYFKFTCQLCGERCTFNEPNMLYERGECCRCGVDQPVTQYGFSMEIRANTL